MGEVMSDGLVTTDSTDSAESFLRDELARGDATLGTVAPILRHLLLSEDNSIFGDEVIARVRGMSADVASQLLHELADAGEYEGADVNVNDV